MCIYSKQKKDEVTMIYEVYVVDVNNVFVEVVKNSRYPGIYTAKRMFNNIVRPIRSPVVYSDDYYIHLF